MKFLEKVKNMFTEEIEEEVAPIQTEVRKVEIPSPVKVPVKEEVREKNQEEKKEEKFKFPVYFDDKDFDSLKSASEVRKKEEPKIEKQPPKVPKEPPRKEAYGGKKPAFNTPIKEERKTFKPTPIISPVYGVLDKNYKKDDIVPKKRVVETYSSKALTVDDVRNKAFGTLEDDLETTLFGSSSILFNQETKELEENLDLLDELDIQEEKPRHGDQETLSRTEKNRELELLDEVENLEQIVINERPEIVPPLEESKEETSIKEPIGNMVEDEMDKICNEPEEELTESDLFNLIDSMYEKKDGEE